MQSHSPVTMAEMRKKDALIQVELLEMSARSILLAMQVKEINELDREGVWGLRNTLRTRDLPFVGSTGVNRSGRVILLAENGLFPEVFHDSSDFVRLGLNFIQSNPCPRKFYHA